MVARFATTQWSVVLKAQSRDSSEARGALAQLCEAYWYPIFAFVRRSGCDTEEARDLTQAYFTRLLEKDFLASVRPEAGRFRSFLLASLKHFLCNEWDKQKTLKRGGHLKQIAIGPSEPELGPAIEPSDELTPEAVFERRWAQTLAERSLERLRRDAEARGKQRQFEELHVFLTSRGAEPSYREVGARLGLTPGAVRVAVHRLRQRYGRFLRAEVAETVSDPREVDDELRYLLSLLSEA